MRSVPILLILLLGVSFTLIQASRVTIEARSSLPDGWKFSSDPHPSYPVSFTLLLKQRNLEKLHHQFVTTNDPNHSEYGKYLSLSQVDRLTKPSSKAFEAVKKWLSAYPGAKSEIYSDSVKVTAPVSVASKILGSEFKAHHHVESGKVLVRVHGNLSVPEDVFQHLDFIAGATELFLGQAEVSGVEKRSEAAKRAGDKDPFVTPKLLRDWYGIPEGLLANNTKNLQGIAAFYNYFSSEALSQFQTKFNVPKTKVATFGNSCLPDCDAFESDLDVQYMSALGKGSELYFVQQYRSYWILQFVTQVINDFKDRFPLVFSISYGWPELEQCQIAPLMCQKLGYTSKQYVDRTNTGLQKLGAAGITVIVSDGDDGAPALFGSSGNCPMNKDKYCPKGGCQETSTQCAEFMIKGNDDFCAFPMGKGSDGCRTLLSQGDVQSLINKFLSQTGCHVGLEKDQEKNPQFYSDCTCDKLPKFSSDDGSFTISGYEYDLSNGAPFTAKFPTSSPFVTAVGATQFTSKDGSKPDGEIVCSIENGAGITTGGGFSTFQKAESYQTKAVQDWLTRATKNNNVPAKDLFDTQFRAYPDVAFNGHHYVISYSQSQTDKCPCQFTLVDGTSASAPAFAGMITLVNDIVLSGGKTQLGFLNPLLYDMAEKYPAAFRDITQGNNRCNRAYCCELGYEAQEGWDPVSGLGSPVFPEFVKYVKKVKGL